MPPPTLNSEEPDKATDHDRKSREYAEQGQPVHPSRHAFTRSTCGNAAVVHIILPPVIAAAAWSRTSTRHHWACANDLRQKVSHSHDNEHKNEINEKDNVRGHIEDNPQPVELPFHRLLLRP